MAYRQPAELVGSMADWEAPAEIWERKVNPSVEVLLPGRRSKLRIPSIGEYVNQRTMKCECCNEPTHNRKRCKNLITSNPN